ncbi:MAG: dihydrofolate reductase family protein [Ferruginibacter sp.]
MRKLIVSSFITLDGIISKPWEWAGPFFDEENQQFSLDKLNDTDLFLLGRKTYEQFSATWPNIKGNQYFDRINELKKVVASTTLKEVEWNASLIKGDAIEEIAKLKARPGKNILRYGIGKLERDLLNNNLIDEFHFSLVPIKLGNGVHAFDIFEADEVRLKLADTKAFKNGVVFLSYVPDKQTDISKH